jgi:aryl-alcohol dehydrogenase-like predicted oxidoreductase
MFRRELGHSGLMVSEVGMGCNRLGEAYHNDAQWVALVRQALDEGVTLFDTSAFYQAGRSEELLGQALGQANEGIVASKVVPNLTAEGERFSRDYVLREAEASLRRLRREQIEIYQLHSPSREDLQREEWIEALAHLQQSGKIRLRGVAISSTADGVWLIEQGLADVLQITYNIFEDEAEERLLPLAAQHGVGLLGRMPLARGVLTGKFVPGQPVKEAHRAALDGDKLPARIQLAEQLRPLAQDYPGGMARLALHFSLTPPAISAIIPGARTPAQLRQNVAASNGHGLPAEVAAELRRIRTAWPAA